MKQHHVIIGMLILMGVAENANGQLIRGDVNFPIINELRWGVAMSEVQALCQTHQLVPSVTDSNIVLQVPVLGFGSRTELQFDQALKTLKRIQAKFSEPSKALADSVTNHLTRVLGRSPVRTAKEKSLLIVTIRLEMAMWNSPTGLVNLVTATRGESLFDASLVLIPPTTQQAESGKR
jgi:hypothetical protein